MELSFTEPPGTWPLTAQDVHAPHLELNEHMAGKICWQEKKKKRKLISRGNGTNYTEQSERLWTQQCQPEDEELGAAHTVGHPQGNMLCVSSDHSWLLPAPENPAVLSLLTTVSLTSI